MVPELRWTIRWLAIGHVKSKSNLWLQHYVLPDCTTSEDREQYKTYAACMSFDIVSAYRIVASAWACHI